MFMSAFHQFERPVRRTMTFTTPGCRDPDAQHLIRESYRELPL
jgi:hypothetical protein